MASADDLRNKLMNAAVQSNITLGVALADRLNLFPAIADSGSSGNPGHFSAIANKADLKPRYVKELLALLACGDIIQVTPDGEHFYIQDEHLPVLTSAIKDKSLALINFVPLHAFVFPKIVEVMQKDGPLGMDYSDYNAFYGIMDEFSTILHKKHLVPDLVPMTGMKEQLEAGIEFLDVGCGSGFHIRELAEAFPKTHFTGIDLTGVAIEKCLQHQKDPGQERTEFHQMNARAMDPTWTDKFDMVMIFDACHDQCRPDLAVKEIHRVLKPGGVFAMVEIDGTSCVHNDKETFGSRASIFYCVSVFHCLPVGSNAEDALGMGTMMGTKTGAKLLTDAGFSKVEVKKIPFFDFNVLYLAYK